MLTGLSSDVGWPSATLVQHSPDVGLMYFVYWVAIIHHLMLGHCLQRLPNFNPSMGLKASCFLVVRKHLPVKSPAYHSLASSGHTHLHRHRKRWASVTDAGPTLIQHWFNASCLLCLTIIGLEQFRASVNVRQWWDSYGSLAIGAYA